MTRGPALRRRGRRRPGRRRDERGASLVEFALILPLFALMLFGMIDFGLVFGGFISLQNRVNAAGRVISVDAIPAACTGAGVANPVLCAAQQVIGSSFLGVVPGSVKVAVVFPTGSDGNVAGVGDPVIVCAQATVQSSTGITSAILNGRTIHASSELLLEQAPSVPASDDGGPGGTSSEGYTC